MRKKKSVLLWWHVSDVTGCLKLESIPKTIKLNYSMSQMCKMITNVEHSQTADPIHKRFVEVCVNDSEYHQYGCHGPWMTQPALFGVPNMYDCIKNSNLHILLAAALPYHKCLIVHDEGLIGCSKRSKGTCTPPVSDYCHVFGYIKMQSTFPYV